MVADNTSIANGAQSVPYDAQPRDQAPVAVVVRRLSELSDAERGQWRSLETRALEPSVYLGCDFVESLATCILPDADIRLVAVERRGQGPRQYIAVLPVVRSRLARWLPLPGLGSVDSKYAFLGGMLLDREHAVPAADALFGALQRRRWRWFALRLRNVPFDTSQGAIIRGAAARAGFYWRPSSLLERPCLKNIDEPGRDQLGGLCGKRLREWRRQRRRLAERGELDWRLLEGDAIDSAVIERFLELEHGGWKGDSGSSLLSASSRVEFFNRVVSRLASQNRVFFTELLVDGAVIAATVNFRIDRVGFAFKIGWDPSFAKFGPGILNELEFIERIPENGAWGLQQLDSGAMPGSFIERLWTDRVLLANGLLTANPLATRCLRFLQYLQHRRDGRSSRHPSKRGGGDAFDGIPAGKSV